MYNGKTVLVVVPARGGSKGIPRKNLSRINGESLVARVGRFVRTLNFVDQAVISSDDEEIRAEGRRVGLSAPFVRPASLSGDRVGDVPVLLHSLTEMERIEQSRYDVVVMLQPTSPLRTAASVHDSVAKLVDEGLDSVWTVSRTDLKFHPLKQLLINDSGFLNYFLDEGAGIIARQQLTQTYFRNGAAYAISRDCLINKESLLSERSGAIVTEHPCLSIDTPDELTKVEQMLKEPLFDIN